eukprot:1768049-Pleurochrysis_carterae.AAC.1
MDVMIRTVTSRHTAVSTQHLQHFNIIDRTLAMPRGISQLLELAPKERKLNKINFSNGLCVHHQLTAPAAAFAASANIATAIAIAVTTEAATATDAAPALLAMYACFPMHNPYVSPLLRTVLPLLRCRGYTHLGGPMANCIIMVS